MKPPREHGRTFGMRVMEHRDARRWSQTELARRVTDAGYTMHQVTVSRLENGQRCATVDEAAIFALVFDVDLIDLLR